MHQPVHHCTHHQQDLRPLCLPKGLRHRGPCPSPIAASAAPGPSHSGHEAEFTQSVIHTISHSGPEAEFTQSVEQGIERDCGASQPRIFICQFSPSRTGFNLQPPTSNPLTASRHPLSSTRSTRPGRNGRAKRASATTASVCEKEAGPGPVDFLRHSKALGE